MDHVNDLDDRTVWQSSLERSISTVAIMLSFTPSFGLLSTAAKVAREALWYIVPIYTKLIHIISILYYVIGIIYSKEGCCA